MHIVLMMYIPWWCKQKKKKSELQNSSCAAFQSSMLILSAWNPADCVHIPPVSTVFHLSLSLSLSPSQWRDGVVGHHHLAFCFWVCSLQIAKNRATQYSLSHLSLGITSRRLRQRECGAGREIDCKALLTHVFCKWIRQTHSLFLTLFSFFLFVFVASFSGLCLHIPLGHNLF